MDPITHTLTGAALSRAGLQRATPLATATLVLAANAPDIDIFTYFSGTYAPMALRRGVTHGPLALLLLPLLVAAVIVGYDRFVRRRRRPETTPVDARAVIVLAFIGVLTHSPLDWMNTYGIRLLMPFGERWYYGDALFIIDPWVWLLLAAPLAVFVRGRGTGWIVFALACTALVAVAPVPPLARLVWAAAVLGIGAAAVVVLRKGADANAHAAVGAQPQVRRSVATPGRTPATPSERAAGTALAAVIVYLALMIGSDRAARAETWRLAESAGIRASDIMVAPLPANPFAGEIVIVSDDAYHLGTFDWLATPRARLTGVVVPFGPRDGVVAQALELEDVRHYLTWSRFPYVVVSRSGDASLVSFRDARYATESRGLHGPTVHVGADGAVVID